MVFGHLLFQSSLLCVVHHLKGFKAVDLALKIFDNLSIKILHRIVTEGVKVPVVGVAGVAAGGL